LFLRKAFLFLRKAGGRAMARPRKRPEDQRRHVVNIRLTDAELAQLKQQAQAAGLPYGRFAREAVLGRRPRARPAKALLFESFVFALQKVATNFNQLAEATGDSAYTPWARYTGGQLVELLVGRDDLLDLMERQLDPLGGAGHMVNGLARAANSGEVLSDEDRDAAFELVRAALEPLDKAARHGVDKKDQAPNPVSGTPPQDPPER